MTLITLINQYEKSPVIWGHLKMLLSVFDVDALDDEPKKEMG